MKQSLSLLLLALSGSAGLCATGTLTLHPDRASATDLALTGRLAGVPAGETRFVRWADLRALPSARLSAKGTFMPGARDVTVVFLSDLWSALPRTAGADVLLATCTDGYASVYRAELMAEHRPYLILEVNGLPPGQWPAAAMNLHMDPGSYAIWVSTSVAPAVTGLLDAGHKRPLGVTTLEVASFADRFQGSYHGRWEHLSPRAVAGREIWINSCASCHLGPGETFGGSKSDRIFDVLAFHARDRPEFFTQYVRAPKSVRPDAKMEAHAHYTDVQMAALVAFVTAEPPAPAASVTAATAEPVARNIRNRAELVEFITATLKAWETGDAPAFLSAFADDAVFAYPGGRLGKNALLAMFVDLQKRKSEVKIYVGPFIVAGNEFALRYQFACTDRITGKRQAVGTGVRGTLRNGQIVKYKEYWDAHIPVEQMAGTMPLDEGDAGLPAPATFMLDPKRVN